jgi:hypothetical protein
LDAAEIRQRAADAAEAGDQPALVELAKAYTAYLSPMFHLIPWDERVLLTEERFRRAYDFAAQATNQFADVAAARLAQTIVDCPATLTVFRIIAGYRVQELAYAVEFRLGAKVSESAIKTIEALDRKPSARQEEQIRAIGVALFRAVEGTLLPRPAGQQGFIDRHDKFDTKHGWSDVAGFARSGVPYVTALYERYLGRPFAYVVDALSEMKADLLEVPIEALFRNREIPHYRSKTIDRIPGFEQAPDFLVPNVDNPQIVIEAKLAEDGGTARDKASRIDRLSRTTESRGLTLIAVVDGKGFFRINDVLAPILRVTKGLTFTLSTLEALVDLPCFAPFRR